MSIAFEDILSFMRDFGYKRLEYDRSGEDDRLGIGCVAYIDKNDEDWYIGDFNDDKRQYDIMEQIEGFIHANKLKKLKLRID